MLNAHVRSPWPPMNDTLSNPVILQYWVGLGGIDLVRLGRAGFLQKLECQRYFRVCKERRMLFKAEILKFRMVAIRIPIIHIHLFIYLFIHSVGFHPT